ncbi:hypothetical protein E2C01_007295 [Portunus trituberculatus]|uniref:Uncharacterized protein n=1 Tax=Portunus trituberculatus TaxID=210409 RepID=A0A5B7CXI0_PORTR|nr:hypothetical protein [Portunus trituberculatus]
MNIQFRTINTVAWFLHRMNVLNVEVKNYYVLSNLCNTLQSLPRYRESRFPQRLVEAPGDDQLDDAPAPPPRQCDHNEPHHTAIYQLFGLMALHWNTALIIME